MELLEYLRCVTSFEASGFEDLHELRAAVLSDNFGVLWETSGAISGDTMSLMLRGAALNERISHRGIVRPYGLGIGHHLWSIHTEQDPLWMVRTFTASTLDFFYAQPEAVFMEAQECPVRGILATVPIIVAANAMSALEKDKAEALALSVLVCGAICGSLPPKAYYERLVAAACGSAAGIARLKRATAYQAEAAVTSLIFSAATLPQLYDARDPRWQRDIINLSGSAYLAAQNAHFDEAATADFKEAIEILAKLSPQ